MILSKFSEELIQNLKKLIGSNIISIYLEGGRISKGEGLVLDGSGVIVFVFKKNKNYYKLRLKFHEVKEGIFYSEFYEWENQDTTVYNPLTTKVDYNLSSSEDFHKYHIALDLSAKYLESFHETTCLKSIKIYHYEAKYDDGSKYDYVAIIDFESQAGRRIIIEEDDNMYSFYLYIDYLDIIDTRLAEIHDDAGETYGQKRYKLRYLIN